MTIDKKLEVIEEAFNYYHDRTSLTKKQEKEIIDLVNELKEAISVTRSCELLNGKKIIPFDDWIELKKYTQLTPNLYKKGQTYINHESLFKQYKSEQGV